MRINGYLNVEQGNTSSISDILSRLGAGDIVRAKVLEIAAGELMLKLADGTLLNAATMTPIDVKPGDTVDFIIKSNINNQIIMETLKSEGGDKKAAETATVLKKELADIGIKPDSRALKVAAELKSKGIPLDKVSIDKILENIVRFRDLSPEKAAYLVSKNIIPAEKSISSLNQIVEQKLKLGTEIENLFREISGITDEETKGLIAKKLSLTEVERQLNEKPMNMSALKSEKDTFKTNVPVSDIVNKEFEVLNNASKTLELKQKIIDLINNSDPENIKTPQKLFEIIKSGLGEHKNIIFTDKGNIDITLGNIVNRLKEQSENQDKINEAAQNKVVRDTVKGFEKDDLSSSLEKLFLKFDTGTIKEDVKNIYKDMFEKLEIIKNTVMNSSIENRDSILLKVDNLQNNIKFINEINNHAAYFQIPVKFFDKHASGELYVLKREAAKKRIDPQDSTLFISLNTPNLGQVDSLISVYRKNISLNMRVESEEIIGYLKESCRELYNGLDQKGYKLVDIKYRLMGEEINLLNVEEVVKKEFQSKRQNIDFRI